MPGLDHRYRLFSVILTIFDCDRAGLVYPCDPEAAWRQVPMERTCPEYPGALALGIDIPTDPGVAQSFRIIRAASGPVCFGPESEYPLLTEVSQDFDLQSFMGMALNRKVGKPWQFVLNQCSYPRVWTLEEERLFQEIGRRVGRSLTQILDLVITGSKFSENNILKVEVVRLSPLGSA